MYKKLVWLIVCNSQFTRASASLSFHDLKKIQNLKAEIVEHRRVEAYVIAGYHNESLLKQAELALKSGNVGEAESHLFCYRHACPCRPIIKYHK